MSEPVKTILITCGQEGADAIAAALQAAPFTTGRIIASHWTRPGWNGPAMYVSDVFGGAGVLGYDDRAMLIDREHHHCDACLIIHREDRYHVVEEAIDAAQGKEWSAGLVIIELPQLSGIELPTEEDGNHEDA